MPFATAKLVKMKIELRQELKRSVIRGHFYICEAYCITGLDLFIRTTQDLAGLLEVEEELADLALDRSKENLQKELEWARLCQKR